ncbi:hypothetical protein E2C01_089671 [Portunus trituberculatus]|uniref:Uncharacterized protein n=1 Tax=Portunus trituberculatus TaxID=210409 RepID=A0A5B7JCN7_PORTR|nr:hypothetical protein [Portunus trituberculatus]
MLNGIVSSTQSHRRLPAPEVLAKRASPARKLTRNNDTPVSAIQHGNIFMQITEKKKQEKT